MAAVASPLSPITKTVLSVNRVEAGSHPCLSAAYPRHAAPSKCSPHEIAKNWILKFNSSLHSGDLSTLKILFADESYWRDQLCVSWDFHTLHGPSKMIDFLSRKDSKFENFSLTLDISAPHKCPATSTIDVRGTVPCVQAWLNVKTIVGKGQGILKLVRDPEHENLWRAFTLFTTLRELSGHEEAIRSRRPNGANHRSLLGRLNWQDRISQWREFEHESPVVLIVGAGQGGLTSAARLKQLGVSTLIIDKSPRIGDSWRNRYHQLVLHDPVWYDHMPYLPFPDNWPVFTPKDKLAEWFEIYAKAMELAVWNSTTIQDAKYNDSKGIWTVVLNRTFNGVQTSCVLHPKHIIQATGHSGEKNFPSHIPGIKEFKGDRLCHSSEFSGARDNCQGKKAVVVGSCNSAHDIAQDFYEKGYNVTMVQRSTTYVMTSKNGIEVLLGGLYNEGGIPTEDADLIFMGIPNPVLKLIHVDVTQEIASRDARLLEGLAAAGFATDNGPDGSGFFMKYIQRGGGYYIDVGCSQLIADRKIQIIHGTEIATINGRSIVFEDGREVDADEIVFATGYQNMRCTAQKIFGCETADRLNDVWGLDEEGELRAIWRRTRHPGFWFMGGNLAFARYYSRLLALQIKAVEVGLME